MSAWSAARRAHIRLRLAVGGMDRTCDNCGAVAGVPCARNPSMPLLDRDWKPDPRPYCGHPVVCETRAYGPGTAARIAIFNGLLRCRTDEDFDAFHAELEPMRLAHFPEATTPSLVAPEAAS